MFDLVILLAVVVANLLLATVVMVANPQAKLNRILAALSATLAVWSIVSYLEDTGLPHQIVQYLVIADFTLSSIMLGLFYWFCSLIAGRKSGIFGKFMVLLVAVNVALSLTGQMVTLQFEPHHVKFIEQLGYPVFLLLMALSIFGGLWVVASKFRHSNGRQRAQLGFVVLGLSLMAVLLVLTNVILPDIITVSDTVTRTGIDGILIFTALSTYAIVRHRFMDIRLIVARSVAYVLLLITLGAVYGAMIFAASALFFHASQTSVTQNLLYVGLAIILAFTFQPLRLFFERVTDRIFFRNRYDSQVVLATLSNLLVSEFNLDSLLKQGLDQICKDLNIGFGQFIIFNEGEVYRSEQYGTAHVATIEIPQLAHLNKPIVVADELDGGQRKAILEKHGLRLSALLRTRDEVVGYLLLGDKLSGDIYSKQDIDVIGIMAKELAVAISNAKAYAEIQAFAATLQERVNHATGRLRVANRHLKELDQAKDEFLSLASHQLRTPLTTIKGYLSMILEGDAGKLNKLQREFTTNAFDSSERMVRLITDLLDVSRMSAGRFVIQPVQADMNEVMRSEVEQLQSHAATKGLKLSFEEPPTPLPPVMLDENKTRQVIMNFVDNAIYYTEKGSVTASLTQAGGKLRIEVRDTGMGVPEDAQKHLFSKFFRAANAQKSRPDGTGLGLFLAKRVIEDQGGEIIFHSEVGKGSTFGFELPMIKPKAGSGGMAKPIISETEPKVAVKA